MNTKTEDPLHLLDSGPSDFDRRQLTPRSDCSPCDFNKQQGTSNHSPKYAAFEFEDEFADTQLKRMKSLSELS